MTNTIVNAGDHAITQPPATPPPCVPRTHTSSPIIRLLKSLPLPTILKKNKQIETENEARSLKTLNHALDPAGHPDPGSEAASLISIDEADLARLKIPAFFNSVRDLIYNSLATRLADEELQEREERKRKGDDTAGMSAEEIRVVKRRCMDGSQHVTRTVGEPVPIEFAQTLHDTERCVAVPLPFFLSKNLRILIDEAATIPTIKSNPQPGETKGIHILDVDKLSTRFGRELSLTCSQWTEAAGNMWSFQVTRDRDGADGKHAGWFEKHFNFFNRLTERDELYDAWKLMELEFRQNHRSRHLAYLAEDYDIAFGLAKANHNIRKEVQDLLAASQPQAPRFPSGSRGNSSHSSFSKTPQRFPSRSHSTSQPFSSGSSKPSSLQACCLICAERGHTVFYHIKSTIAAKFADGKAVWAKASATLGLVTPDNRQICIDWNLRGSEAAANCSHRDERVHLCSFCGSKSHHALSWTCRSKTN